MPALKASADKLRNGLYPGREVFSTALKILIKIKSVVCAFSLAQTPGCLVSRNADAKSLQPEYAFLPPFKPGKGRTDLNTV